MPIAPRPCLGLRGFQLVFQTTLNQTLRDMVNSRLHTGIFPSILRATKASVVANCNDLSTV